MGRSGRLHAKNFGSNIVLISGNSPVDQEGRACSKHETFVRSCFCSRCGSIESVFRDEIMLMIFRQTALRKGYAVAQLVETLRGFDS